MWKFFVTILTWIVFILGLLWSFVVTILTWIMFILGLLWSFFWFIFPFIIPTVLAILVWYGIRQILAKSLAKLFDQLLNNINKSQKEFESEAVSLDKLGEQFRSNPGDKTPFNDIVSVAEHSDRIRRCYALGVLAGLASLSKEVLLIEARLMRDRDPFVRETAAQTLFRSVKANPEAGKDVIQELIHAIRKRVREGTAFFAVRSLKVIGESSPEVLDALEFAINAKNSNASEEARLVRAFLIEKSKKPAN